MDRTRGFFAKFPPILFAVYVFTLDHTAQNWIALSIIRRIRRFAFRNQILRIAPRARCSPGFDGAQFPNDYFETRRFHRERPGNLFARCLFLCGYRKGRLLSFGPAHGDRGCHTHSYRGDHGDRPRGGVSFDTIE